MPGGDSDVTTRALRSKIDNIVVIYAENRAFDNLYGNFPGARGLGEVVGSDGRPRPTYAPQIDRDGSVLSALPPTWGGVTYVRPLVSNATIKDVWKRVAEDYMPFNINVTTVRPPKRTVGTSLTPRL